MKKLILMLLFTSISFAQSNMLLLMDGEVSYKNTETKLYLASLTTPISPTYAVTLDSFITKVKDSLSITSLSSKFDVMYDLGGYSQEQSLKNLVKRSHDATAVNSPTWTQYQGFTGANTKCLNTNFNDSTQGITSALNDNSFGYYSRTASNPAANSSPIGVVSGSSAKLYVLAANGNTYYYNNEVADNVTNSYSNARSGFFITVRGASNNKVSYKNGVGLNALTTASTSRANANVYILANNNAGTPNNYVIDIEISFVFFGAGLTPTEVSKLTNCIEWLMDRKGTGVIP